MTSRQRIVVLTILLACGFVLRAWHPERMAIEHFDEGVYASNFFSGHLGNRYPDQHLYAPPLWPAILEWVLILSGSNPHALMWVNVILGTALIGAVFWTTRTVAMEAMETSRDRKAGGTGPTQESTFTEEFADRSAFAAAVLTAFNELLIEYSRAALTDIPLTLFVTLAVGAGVKALRQEGPVWLLATIGLTALAWWTKYNGWLPLAILGAGIGGWAVFVGPPLREITRVFGTWLVIAIGAFLLWSPVLWHLQQYGGYAAVAKNHAGYVVGLSGWFDSLSRQLLIQRHYSQLFSFLGLLVAVFVCHSGWGRLRQEGTAHRGMGMSFAILGLIATTILAGVFPPLLLLALFLVVRQFRSGRTATLELWILAAWTVGLLVATPMYQPYPRLLLPLLMATIISCPLVLTAASPNIQSTRQLLPKRNVPWFSQIQYPLILFILLVAAGFQFPAWQDRGGLKNVAKQISLSIETTKDPHDLDAAIYVLAEPGLYYHLMANDSGPDIIAQPASNLGMLKMGASQVSIPTYIVSGPHVTDETETLRHSDQVALIKEFEYHPSDLVLLDDGPPIKSEEDRVKAIFLWRVKDQP